jgi:hypothetical protein
MGIFVLDNDVASVIISARKGAEKNMGAGISAKALDGRLRRAAKRLLKGLTAIGLVNGAVSGTGEQRQVQGILEGLPLKAGWRILRASNAETFAWPWVRWGVAYEDGLPTHLRALGFLRLKAAEDADYAWQESLRQFGVQ